LYTGLKKKSDFKKVYDEGARFDSTFFAIFWKPNDLGEIRTGFSVSRKVGKACRRNLVRRWFKNANYGLAKKLVKESEAGVKPVPGIDFVMVARPDALRQGYFKILERLSEFYRIVIGGGMKL